MRLFKYGKALNWRYIVGEIILIFVGINLAIWFNNWNASRKADTEKEAAITKITEELKSNQQELEAALNNYSFMISAYYAFDSLYDEQEQAISCTPRQMAQLRNAYLDFFLPTDSTALGNGRYSYDGSSNVYIELPDLSEIAWETARSVNISNRFTFNCLYELETLYSLQRRVQKEVDKASDALQQQDMEKFIQILQFLKQLADPLQERYATMAQQVGRCK